VRKNAPVQLPDTSAPVPAGPGRRAAAVVVNAVLLAAVVAFSVRSIADFKRERIPPAIDRATACEVLNRGITTTWCEVRGEVVVYSANSHPVARVVLPPLAVSFANSVVLPSLIGATAGQLVLGLRVRRRDTNGRVGLLTHLLRWPLWPVAAFGAVVVRAGRAPVPGAAAPDPATPDAATPDAAAPDPATPDAADRDEPAVDSSSDAPASMQPVPGDRDPARRSPFTEGS
jgi:hypothetical protein